LLCLKSARRNLRQVLRPNRVEVIRVNREPVAEKVIANTNAYLAIYVGLLALSFLVVSFDGFSVTTNFSAVMVCFNNIGPGLEAVGPSCNFSLYSGFSKGILIFDMLAGRLEIFPILVLFSPGTWKKN